MTNKKIIEAWNKIEPGRDADERMLTAILARNHPEKRRAPYWKILVPIAAFSILAATVIPNLPKSSVNQPAITDPVTSTDYPLSLPANPIYENVDFLEQANSGGAQSYDELEERLRIYEPVNFVKYEIIGVYTPDEAVKITGEDFFKNASTLYKIRIVYDYLNQEEVNIEANVAKAGFAETQIEGSPLYMIGEVYISPLLNLDKFLNRETALCVGMGELTFAFHTIKNVDFAYLIKTKNIDFIDEDNKNLDLGILVDEEFVITSAKNNPVNYTRKLSESDLADFIRNDWIKRGLNVLDLKTYN